MKVMIDTNIMISSILFPNSLSSKAFIKSLLPPFEAITSDYIITELKDKFNEKFSNHLDDLNQFLSVALESIEIISTPQEINMAENNIRDIKDRPILRAAILANVDYILTGDKDFLESGISKPVCISASEFIKL